jgi:hypothetical protein
LLLLLEFNHNFRRASRKGRQEFPEKLVSLGHAGLERLTRTGCVQAIDDKKPDAVRKDIP